MESKRKQPRTLTRSRSLTTSFATAKSYQPSSGKRVSASHPKTTVPSKRATRSQSAPRRLPGPKRSFGKSQLDKPFEMTTASYKHDDKGSNIRKQIFWLLHRPTGFEYIYHLVMVLLVIISCCALNLLKPKHEWNDDFIYKNYWLIHLVMCGMDSLLLVLLFAELLLRFWAADHRIQYRTLTGKGLYLHDYLFPRLLDLAAVFTLLGYLVFNYVTHMDNTPVETLLAIRWWSNLDTAFRFALVLQVLQVYRVIFKLVRPIYTTLYQQANQLFLALFVVVVIMLMCSLMVFLTNICTSTAIPVSKFSTSIWHSFVAFSTLGYDSDLPYSKESILVLSFCAVIGVGAFTLPSIILGNGLSITVADQRRMTFKYVSIAEMIRTAISHQQTRRDQMRGEQKLKKRSHLLTDHLKSFTKLNLITNDRLFKINYDELDYDDHSHADDAELWDKLLTTDHPKALAIRTASKNQKKKSSPTDSQTMQSKVKLHRGASSSKGQNKSADRVLDCFQNMDLSKYSNDNSLLWFNLGLIEEGMDEMTDVVCGGLVKKVNKIRKLTTKLMADLAAAQKEQNTCCTQLNQNDPAA